MSKTLAYVRVSTEQQDADSQKVVLLEYALKKGLDIDEWITVTMSTRRSEADRLIDRLHELGDGDTLLAVELSRLGRSMVEVINLVTDMIERGVNVILVRNPEISSGTIQSKLLLAIYAYFAEAERDFISQRTKQALAAKKAAGIKLGRRRGSKNKSRLLDPYRDDIKKYLKKGISMSSVQKLVNSDNRIDIGYNTYRQYVMRDEELEPLWVR